MATIVEGTGVVAASIDLYALFGEFQVGNSPYTIRFAATFGSPSELGHRDLLQELKPVRERLDPSEIRDLTSLLQRDLNDARVASELIPYLQGQKAKIGFFPSVLAVLVPRNFFKADGQVEYPRPTRVDDLRVDYANCWSTERYQLPGVGAIPLGKLKIFRDNAEVMVLDGQHRANAFRYLSGDWNPSGDIYEAFYDQSHRGEGFDADLPVTVIWFEGTGENKVHPQQISRQLFVDVNNSAKPVSEARTILLDDRSVTSVGVQQVYNSAAENGFDTEQFSLLHSAFDMDSDLAKASVPKFTLTTPEIIAEAVHWGLFCNPGWKQLSQWRVQRQWTQRNTDRLADLLGSLEGIDQGTYEDEIRFLFVNGSTRSAFRSAFETSYVPIFVELFNRFKLLKPHYEACGRIERWVKDESTRPIPQVWDKVFTGGEGLYWSFQVVSPGTRYRNYREAIAEVENRFANERAGVYGSPRNDVDQIYRSFTTKAFQIGYVMAVDYIASRGGGDGEIAGAGEELVTGFNQYSLEQWRSILLKLKPLLISGTDPKAWPAYRNMLLRLYEADSFRYMDRTKLQELPEWQALKAKIAEIATAISTTVEAMPSAAELQQYVAEQIPAVEKTFAECGLESDILQQGKVLEEGTADLKRRLQEELIIPDNSTS